ncbi:viperin family antiviral radical SAM protein [Flavobacterium celericrescens]|uniref:S-adenosylmethionine-dependent nucleotide dehydratase n=1 Tax=Flavobacterium celericrescens TaxID=2709780 RepID=A0ABX0IAF7_9FLAO|nr:viperin family antiviral radical SAM protein [Flavobacterium celericrescens]NHM04084.1 radical SAM protein [Flavobacterium celericrescens]
MIPAVNFHLWEPCNMRCHFCFATFQDVKKTVLPKGHLPKEQAIEVVVALAQSGFQKITFAGGEPTLCPWLSDLIATAKKAGMTTMIVTNGTNLTDAFLENNKLHLDWITLSVDSLVTTTNLKTGRAVSGKKNITETEYYRIVDKIKSYGYKLKINTVVSAENYNEKLIDFIEYAQPSRWKIFQVLPITGQNDLKVNGFLISENDFNQFLENNRTKANNKIVSVPETNTQMKGSYVMVDPAGRFFNNATGKHYYSNPILEVGCENALQQMNYDVLKFEERGGLYDWKNKQEVA